MREERRLAAVAHHEAGHAIVAQALGHLVEYATVVPSAAEGTLGHVRLGRSRSFGMARFEELAAIFMAGIAAQRIFAPRSGVRDCGAGDLAWIDDHGSIICAVGNQVEAPPEQIRPFARQAARRARAIVLERWWQVHRVAEHLVQARSLSGFGIASIAAEAADEWAQLSRYHPGTAAPELMRRMIRARRPRAALGRAHLARAALRAAPAGATDLEVEIVADLTSRGILETAVRSIWSRVAANA